MAAERESSTAPADTESIQSAPSAPELAAVDTSATTDERPDSSNWPEDENLTKKESDASSGANGKGGKESKPGTPRSKTGRRGGKDRNKEDEKEKKEKDKDKDNAAEGKAKKPAPYVNEDRFKTGGTPREKLSPEELAERMERIRANNEKIKERRAAVQADEQAFQESQAVQRAKQARQKKIQATIDEKRAAVAKRKMERAGGREWDSFKKGANPNVGGEEGTDASIHAPMSPDAHGDNNTAEDNENGTKEGWSAAPGQSPWAGSEGERGRGRGRGTSRGRGRGGRGGGSARGRGGGPAIDTRREKAPHVKDFSQDKSEDADTGGDWGTGADEWGKGIDGDSDVLQQTGIAITTNEADLWSPVGDDPWGTAAADDPWGAPPAETQKS